MNTLRLTCSKFDIEKMMITLAMAFMEASGVVFLICGLFDIRIF